MLELVSRYVVHPLYNAQDRGRRAAKLRALQRTQWLPAETHLARQSERLRHIVTYAYEHSAYYRRRFDSMHLNPRDLSLPRDLPLIPPLTKEDIRQNMSELVSDLYPRQALAEARTGGSTGTALVVLFDRECQALRNAAGMRSDVWAGWRPGILRFALWGNPPRPKSFKARMRRLFFERMVYLDTVRFDDAAVAAFLARYVRAARSLIYGHSHSIYLLACHVRDRHLAVPRPLGIISTSMSLLAHERETIEAIFRCPVTDRYGCEEVGLIAAQCEQHADFHVNADHVFVEIVDDAGRPSAPGEDGEIVVTDLVNHGMPLLRYKVGDLAAFSTEACACGRGLPLLSRLAGRTADFLVRPDGSRVAGVSLIERTLTAIPGIRQMQLVQEVADRLIVNLVPASDYGPAAERRLLEELANVFGPGVTVDVKLLDRIAGTARGKYRFSICTVDANAGPGQNVESPSSFSPLGH